MALFTNLAERMRDFCLGALEPPTVVKCQASAADYLWFSAEIGAHGSPPGVPCCFTFLALCVTWFAMTRASGASLAQKLSHLKKVFTRPPCLSPWTNEREREFMCDLRRGLAKTFGGPGSKGPSEVLGRELLDKVKEALHLLFHHNAAVVMCALLDHLHDGVGRGDEVLHAYCSYCRPEALEFYEDAVLFNFSHHVHPPKTHKVHGPPVPQVISRGRPAYDSLLRLRELHVETGCTHCYPRVSLQGVVDASRRLTQTTARKRMRVALAHVLGSTEAAAQHGLHGCRAGGVVDALLRGVPPSAIKAQGHWALDSAVMEKHARFSTQQRMRFF
jgi:hypothetical protein